MNWIKFTGSLLLVLSPVNCFAQSSPDTPKTLSTSELCSRVLQTEDRTTASALLRQNKSSITRFLWMRLITEAVKNSNAGKNAKASFVLVLAKVAAEQREDKELLGHTYYRMGYLLFS